MTTLIGITLLTELVPLGLAALVALGFWIVPVGRRRITQLSVAPSAARARPDAIVGGVLTFGAGTLALWSLAVAVVNLQGSSFHSADVHWWKYAQELLVAIVALTILFVTISATAHAPREPTLPIRRRGALSYVRAGDITMVGVTLTALFLVVAMAGAASGPDDDGNYVRLTIDAGGDLSASTSFFGWTYGLPVAIAAIVLCTLGALSVRALSMRPFSRPDDVVGDEEWRRALSARIAWFAAGALMLTLGSALSSVGASAELSLSADEYAWSSSLAALSPWLRGAGAFVATTGTALLLLVASTTRIRR